MENGYAIYSLSNNEEIFIEGSYETHSPYKFYKDNELRYLGPGNYFYINEDGVYNILDQSIIEEDLQAASYRLNDEMTIQTRGSSSKPDPNQTTTDINGYTVVNRAHYFKNLTAFPENWFGECGLIALSIMLSYYDTFYNDNFIPNTKTYDARYYKKVTRSGGSGYELDYTKAENLTKLGSTSYKSNGNYSYTDWNTMPGTTNYFKSKISYNRIIEFLNFEDANIYGGEENLDNKYSIKIRNVSFAYDEISVFSNFSASINEGEIVVLKGGNGVGKTTLCRLLTRYIYPSSGQIYVGKHDISEIDISVYRKNIIFIGEATILQNSFRKNIDFYDKYSDAEIMSVLEQCNLTSLLEKKGWSLKDVNYINEKELSLGEKQKIAIARALICRPKILVLDEPTANLDDYTTNQIISNLVKYNSDEKCTIIVAAHDQRIDNYITKKIYL